MVRAARTHEYKERRYQRATCDFPAEFTWGTISHQARVVVISIGGTFLDSEVKIPLEQELTLTFTINPAEPPISCQGKVVWLADKGILVWGKTLHRGFAVEFMKMFPEDRARIDEYVRERIRIFRAIDHELCKQRPDKVLVKELFQQVRPGESTHLGHIKKACCEEKRHYRLSK